MNLKIINFAFGPKYETVLDSMDKYFLETL